MNPSDAPNGHTPGETRGAPGGDTVETAAEIAARFDERADRYDESSMHRGLAAAVVDFALRDSAIDAASAGPRTVLDVATGTGLVLRYLNADPRVDWTGSQFTGIDISDGMLAVARTALPSARFVNADAARLPFDDDSFDLITCVTALHLFPNASAAMLEWRRVLRPAGRIVVATFAVDTQQHGGGQHVGHGTTAIERHAPFGSPGALESFAQTVGLRLTAAQTWTSPPEAEKIDVCLIAELAAT
jgi:ubiquinone/menaquinone biosynthesis C-methylase UbiE